MLQKVGTFLATSGRIYEPLNWVIVVETPMKIISSVPNILNSVYTAGSGRLRFSFLLFSVNFAL